LDSNFHQEFAQFFAQLGFAWGAGQGMFGWKKWLILLEFTKLGGNIIVSFDGNFGKLRFLDDGMRSSTG
jgi:hypothetical protein